MVKEKKTSKEYGTRKDTISKRKTNQCRKSSRKSPPDMNHSKIKNMEAFRKQN